MLSSKEVLKNALVNITGMILTMPGVKALQKAEDGHSITLTMDGENGPHQVEAYPVGYSYFGLDDLNDAVGEKLQELEKKVNEACDAYVYSRGNGGYAIRRLLEKILNRLTNGGKASVKFYDINIAHPDDEDIITQACDINIHVGERSYTFKYVVPLSSKPFFDDSITVFCATNGLSNDMVTTMKNLYMLRCCLGMAFNHVEVIGSEDKTWFFNVYRDVVDMYYKDSELLERFVVEVYTNKPDYIKTYCFTNS
jgi:hypothetical protein|nr:MAG TPA: hypothetical protein [Caudoviricetes sp.]